MKSKNFLARYTMLLSMVLCFLFSACGNPPVGSETQARASEYHKFNEYVNQTLKMSFKGLLPEVLTEKENVLSYAYNYKCAIFGDPNFKIDLKVELIEGDFYKERQRIMQLQPAVFFTDSGLEYCFLTNDMEIFNDYIDDEIKDALYFNFEFAVVDNEKFVIEYVTAQQWDYYPKDPLLQKITHLALENYGT